MSAAPKFTIIIPTRQRADVLGPALQTVLSQNYDNLQVLVSDNFSDDNTEEVVRSFNDSRVTYVNTGRRLSMSHNWEFALSHVNDGWLAVVGDDDGLLPGALNRVAGIVSEYDVKAVMSMNAAYTWPFGEEEPYGRLSVGLKRGVDIRDSSAWLERVVAGKAAYSELPMLYTGGFVDYELIRQGSQMEGRFYHSMIPDVYSAMVFSRLTDRYAYCHEPLAIGGSSRHSAGTSHFSKPKQEQAANSPAAQFFSETNIPFHAELVAGEDEMLPPSIELLTYESWLQSEFLGADGAPKTTHQQQLPIILGRSKRRLRGDVEAWGRDFSRSHGLDFAAASKKAARVRWNLKLKKAVRSLFRRGRRLDVAGSRELPIRDVYDASIVVSTLVSQCR